MDFQAARVRLVDYLSGEIQDRRVLDAMSRVPRELFVPEWERHFAYEDSPLPIGLEQTISQPFIVALMTRALDLKGTEKVLELGTGSGYQTAILAELAGKVVSVERLPSLAENAGRVLKKLGYKNITLHIASDTLGWPEEAPYDAIIATAAAPTVPPELLAQLDFGGRMVIPVGSRFSQELYKITLRRKGSKLEKLGGCRFVPLLGKGAWEEE
jgi:protein-L-isoaspartate(D-aspartate) O-methyltransferase